jgi:hypothetical protein
MSFFVGIFQKKMINLDIDIDARSTILKFFVWRRRFFPAADAWKLFFPAAGGVPGGKTFPDGVFSKN